MNQSVSGKEITIRGKTPIVLLSIAALIFKTLSCISYFAYYDYNGFEWKLEVIFPPLVNLFYLLLSIAPYILFVLYILKFYKDFKARILVPIIFGLIAFLFLFNLFNDIRLLFAFRDYRDDDIFFSYSVSSIISLFYFIVFGLAAFSALKGFEKRGSLVPLVIGTVAEVLQSVLSLRSFIVWYLEEELYLYLFTEPAATLGKICFYTALLLFTFKNRIPAIISTSRKKVKEMTPEQALRALKNRLDWGMISEEEYQAQKAEIISKL